MRQIRYSVCRDALITIWPSAHGRGISPTVYITRPDADKLEVIAKKRGVSVCEVIRNIIREYFK